MVESHTFGNLRNTPKTTEMMHGKNLAWQAGGLDKQVGAQFCLPCFHFAAMLALGKCLVGMLKSLGSSLMENRILKPKV